jgi:hypothetical protein
LAQKYAGRKVEPKLLNFTTQFNGLFDTAGVADAGGGFPMENW